MRMKYVRLDTQSVKGSKKEQQSLYIYFYINLHLKKMIVGTENLSIVMDKTGHVRKMVVHW